MILKKIPRIFAIGALTSYISVVGVCANEIDIPKIGIEKCIDFPIIPQVKLPIKKKQIIRHEKVVKKKRVRCSIGWTKTSVNVRREPNVVSDILETYSFNKKIKYIKHDDEWVKIKFKDENAYICKKYISKKKCTYRDYVVPNTSGFKSYMSYKCITSTSSPQYKLQRQKAVTGKYGIRQINGRYCVAIGSHFARRVGTLFDLILKNGTIIPCILSDQKSDKDTDSQNIVTRHNGCLSEFIIDPNALKHEANKMGDISYCNEKWNSPVKKIRVYK